MATITPDQIVELRVSITLPPPVCIAYEAEAKEYGVGLEELLSSRLRECVNYNATKPLYFNDQQRRELETILGRNVDKPASVLAVLRNNLTVTVNGLQISFAPNLLELLRTRAPKVADFKTWLQTQITRLCEEYVGLR